MLKLIILILVVGIVLMFILTRFLPKERQPRMRYGITTVMIGLALLAVTLSVLLHVYRFGWLLIILAAGLLLTGARMLIKR